MRVRTNYSRSLMAMRRSATAVSGPPSSADAPWTDLREAHKLLRSRWTRELERFELTLPEYLALEVCGRGTPRASDVARALGLSAAGTTDALDRLESRGFLVRQADRVDRRAIRVRLTAEGRRVRRRTNAAKRATLRYIHAAMTHEEREALSHGLTALTRALRQPVGGG